MQKPHIASTGLFITTIKNDLTMDKEMWDIMRANYHASLSDGMDNYKKWQRGAKLKKYGWQVFLVLLGAILGVLFDEIWQFLKKN